MYILSALFKLHLIEGSTVIYYDSIITTSRQLFFMDIYYFFFSLLYIVPTAFPVSLRMQDHFY